MIAETISTKQESKDVFIVKIKVDGREYQDRFSLGGLKIAIKKETNEDSLGYIIRAAMIKAAEDKIKLKKETSNVRKISKQN